MLPALLGIERRIGRNLFLRRRNTGIVSVLILQAIDRIVYARHISVNLGLLIRSERCVHSFKHGVEGRNRKRRVKREIRRDIRLCKLDLRVIRRSVYQAACCVGNCRCVAVNGGLLGYIQASVNACNGKVESRHGFGSVKRIARMSSYICIVAVNLSICFGYFLIDDRIACRKVFKLAYGVLYCLGIAVNRCLLADIKVGNNSHVCRLNSVQTFGGVK